MGLHSEVSTIYNNIAGSTGIRQVVYPAAAVGTAAVSDGAAAAWAWSAYVQIVAAATIPNPCWLAGVFLARPVVEAFYGDFAIASGAGGAETDLAIFPFDEELFAVVEGKSVTQYLPYPIKIIGTPRLAVRVRKSSAASAAGCTLKVIVLTGLE
jgi:hypothetical protein